MRNMVWTRNVPNPALCHQGTALSLLPQLVLGPHPLSGLVAHSLIHDCPSSLGQEVSRKEQGSRSSCFLIFSVTVSPATCRRWMASLRGRPLRLTLLMASMRSPTWMAPVLRGGQRAPMRPRCSGPQRVWVLPLNTPQRPQGTGLADPSSAEGESQVRHSGVPSVPETRGRGIIRSCLREVGREGTREERERKRGEGSMPASELPQDNSLDSTLYTPADSTQGHSLLPRLF